MTATESDDTVKRDFLGDDYVRTQWDWKLSADIGTMEPATPSQMYSWRASQRME